MARYLIQASYTTEGTKALIKEGGSSRRTAVEKMISGLGGRLEAFYYAFGKTDVIAIADLPDTATALAISMVINASGAVQFTSTPLISPEEVDEACKKSVNYRAPGA